MPKSQTDDTVMMLIMMFTTKIMTTMVVYDVEDDGDGDWECFIEWLFRMINGGNNDYVVNVMII